MADYLVGMRDKIKIGQFWVGLLDLLDTFLRKIGSRVKAGGNGAFNARREKVEDLLGTMRKRSVWLGSSSSLLRSIGSLLIIRSSNALPRSSTGSLRIGRRLLTELLLQLSVLSSLRVVGQRTGAAATRAAETIAVRTAKRILVKILSSSLWR